MPMENKHSARIREVKAAGYVRVRTAKDEFGTGIDVVYGVRRDNKAEVASIRFDAKKFSAAEAKKWLSEHDYKPIKFEEAA
jgi:hypothetical protein